MDVYKAFCTRATDDAIIVTFLNWTMTVLYDSRKTPYDVPFGLCDYPVESVNVTDNLTIIEI